ncbi:MAG: hypothetical protein V4577_15345 [Bacteroidota bacterium]
MKRFILSAAVLVAAGLATAKANTLNINHPTAVVISKADTAKKTPVKLDALPDPIKTVLTSDVFKTWVPTDAYSVTAGATQYFEVDVKKGTETKALKFDKDGKIVQ